MGCIPGCMLVPIRALFTVVFGIIIVLAFVVYLTVNNVTDNLLDAEFYTDALSENDVYERFYDEVLVDPEFEDTKNEILGDIGIPTDDIVLVAQQIITPEYLQIEVERIINAIIDFLNEDTDELVLFIDMMTPLENTKGVLQGYVDDQIDDLEMSERDLDDYFISVLDDLQRGTIPTTLPPLESFSVDERFDAYDDALYALIASGVDQEIIDALNEKEDEIKRALAENDPKLALQEVSEGATTAVIDQALDRLRRELVAPGEEIEDCDQRPLGTDLSGCIKYDVLLLVAEAYAEGDGREVKKDLLDDLADMRDGIGTFTSIGGWLTVLVIVVSCLLLALTYFPRPSSMLRAPTGVLLLTGLVFLVVGLVMNSAIPDRLDYEMKEAVERSDLPPSFASVGTDVVSDMAKDVTAGLIPPSIVLLVVGGILFVTSLVLRQIPFMMIGGVRRIGL